MNAAVRLEEERDKELKEECDKLYPALKKVMDKERDELNEFVDDQKQDDDYFAKHYYQRYEPEDK